MKENPPAQPQLDRIQREILAEQPRVTRLEIPWDDEEHEVKMLQEKAMAEAQVPCTCTTVVCGLCDGVCVALAFGGVE
jgi:hypothetical protein